MVSDICFVRRERLFAVPADHGENVMPDYDALAAQGIYRDPATDIRVFAGNRAETTYVDLSVFNSGLDFGRFPPLLTEEEDAFDDYNPYGNDYFYQNNVNSIAIEIPVERLTADEESELMTEIPFLGAFSSTHVPAIKSRKYRGHLKSDTGFYHRGRYYQQVSRMANPTLNMLVTDIELKQRYNETAPHRDSQYQHLVKDPVFAQLLTVAFGIPVPAAPRTDILSVLYKYPGQPLDGDNYQDPCADLLHLNPLVAPTPPAEQSRLGALLSPDPAGLPNGRRPNDDVFDITLRALGGGAFIFSRAGDGVNFSEAAPSAGTHDGLGYGDLAGNRLDVTENGVVGEFPFLPAPHSVQ